MATLLSLAAVGALFKLDAALDEDDHELRLIYLSERMRNWLRGVLPTLGSTWSIETSPAEQLDALAHVFASGKPLTFNWQFKPLNPIGDGVWELKTADLRVFGWFPLRDCFVAVAADTKERILEHRLYGGYRTAVVHFRDQIALDEPKFVPGEDPHDVVSNFTKPA